MWGRFGLSPTRPLSIENAMKFTIRTVDRSQFPGIQEIELAAFETLRLAGAVGGEAEASSDEELSAYLQDDLLLAAYAENGGMLGYAGAYIADKHLHVGEMDVHPLFQRQGVGRALISEFILECRKRGLAAVTLTTDRYAPFNAPLYASMGFQLLDREQTPERLKAILVSEAAKGLDADRRVAMIYPINE